MIAREPFAKGKKRKLVRANNAAQAYQFWYSGTVDLALLPQAFVPREGHLVPSDWHAPIAQNAYIARSSAELSRYLNWFRSDTVRSWMVEAGYESCP